MDLNRVPLTKLKTKKIISSLLLLLSRIRIKKGKINNTNRSVSNCLQSMSYHDVRRVGREKGWGEGGKNKNPPPPSCWWYRYSSLPLFQFPLVLYFFHSHAWLFHAEHTKPVLNECDWKMLFIAYKKSVTGKCGGYKSRHSEVEGLSYFAQFLSFFETLIDLII